MRILGHRVLLEKVPQKKQSEAGILLPQEPNWRDDRKQWRVLGVGSAKRIYSKRTKQTRLAPIELSVGDRVFVDTGSSFSETIYLDDGRILVNPDAIEAKW